MAEAVGEISAGDLKQRIDQGTALAVLDVREDHERAYASIPLLEGVVDLHVPLGEVAARFDEIDQGSQGRTLVVYCHHGQRSMVAATWLSRRGVSDVVNLEGGIDAWSTRVDRAIRRY